MIYWLKLIAEVAELAYASVSKTDFLTDMRVQLPPSAPNFAPD